MGALCSSSASAAEEAPKRTAPTPNAPDTSASAIDPAVLPEHGGTPVAGAESIMSAKAHGTTEHPVQATLRWNCNRGTSDRICCHNRHYAEHSGYFETTPFVRYMKERGGAPTVFYDSVTGLPLFVAPVGRSVEEFLKESRAHGWPSFRDAEVCWANVRTLSNGESVSAAGTHLGHNLPDRKGNRYCINLVSVAGYPRAPA